MRIAVVAPNIRIPGSHGGSTHVTELVRALGRRHEVLPIVRRGSTEPGSVAIGVGTNDTIVRYVPTLVHFAACYARVRRFRPEAIYERYSANGLGVVLGRLLGVPVVSMVLNPSAVKLTLRGADRLIATAPALVPEPFRHKVTEVSWGANTERFHPGVDGAGVRRALGIADDEFVLGYMGAFYSWHGLETLVAAVDALRDFSRERRVRYLLVGDGQLKPAIDADIEARGLESFFIRPGRVPYDEVPSYVAASDACVAPFDPSKDREMAELGMFLDPLKVFEYLAAGRPTITLEAPNILRRFENGKHLIAVPPGDATALARAVEELVGLPDRGRGMAELGRQLVCERYSWQAHADQLTGIFEELVRERRAAGAASGGA